MAEHSRLSGAVLAGAYDFGQSTRLVDVGGGDGSFLSALLRAHPQNTGVVFDLPYVADAAHKQLAAAGLGERCAFAGGDFLRGVPSGGDIYLLKGVIHNWPDHQAEAILANCGRAMGRQGRLLLIEWLVPTGDTPHPSKLIDLSMLLVYGGRERTEEEYVRLLDAAGLRLTRVLDAPSSLKVIEAMPA
jgi:SAM-dependent methyltransferase